MQTNNFIEVRINTLEQRKKDYLDLYTSIEVEDWWIGEVVKSCDKRIKELRQGINLF